MEIEGDIGIARGGSDWTPATCMVKSEKSKEEQVVDFLDFFRGTAGSHIPSTAQLQQQLHLSATFQVDI